MFIFGKHFKLLSLITQKSTEGEKGKKWGRGDKKGGKKGRQERRKKSWSQIPALAHSLSRKIGHMVSRKCHESSVVV